MPRKTWRSRTAAAERRLQSDASPRHIKALACFALRDDVHALPDSTAIEHDHASEDWAFVEVWTGQQGVATDSFLDNTLTS